LLHGCDKERKECPGATQRSYPLTGFNRVSAGETFHVQIEKGNDFEVVASGCSSDLDDLLLEVNNLGVLEIRYNRYRANRYRVDLRIKMPALLTIIASGASDFTIQGFQGQANVIRTVLSGVATCELMGAAFNTSFDLSGNSKLTVTGQTESLYGNVAGESRLHAYDLIATEVDIAVSATAKAWVFPQQELYVLASGDSRVYYKGDPATRSFQVTGTSRVIREP